MAVYLRVVCSPYKSHCDKVEKDTSELRSWDCVKKLQVRPAVGEKAN